MHPRRLLPGGPGRRLWALQKKPDRTLAGWEGLKVEGHVIGN